MRNTMLFQIISYQIKCDIDKSTARHSYTNINVNRYIQIQITNGKLQSRKLYDS